jgi:hypothetical protein
MELDNIGLIKLFLDNGFATLVTFILLGVVFWLVRSVTRYMEKRDQDFFIRTEEITKKYEQITQNAIATMANIANSFEEFVKINKEEMSRLFNISNQISHDISKIDVKIDKIMYDSGVTSNSRRRAKKEVSEQAN